jgi:hypothetical protein
MLYQLNITDKGKFSRRTYNNKADARAMFHDLSKWKGTAREVNVVAINFNPFETDKEEKQQQKLKL